MGESFVWCAGGVYVYECVYAYVVYVCAVYECCGYLLGAPITTTALSFHLNS